MVNLDEQSGRHELIDLIYEAMSNAESVVKIKIECYYDCNGTPNVNMYTRLIERKEKEDKNDQD